MCFKSLLLLATALVQCVSVDALVPFIDGGKGIPKLYEGYFNEQIAKQADERIEKLKKLSQNIAEAESFKEKIEIPAYLRRNIKLDDNSNTNLNY